MTPARELRELAPGPRVLYEDLVHHRRQFRRVVPSVDYLAKRHGRNPSTIKRWYVELRAAGWVLTVYNGGRSRNGKGRRCIQYLGPRAVARALRDSPEWDAKVGERPAFGGLRMGRVTAAQRARKQERWDLKNEIPPTHYSSRKEGDSSGVPPSENQAPAVTPVAEKDVPPFHPPLGDPMPARLRLASVDPGASIRPPTEPAPAPNPPRPSQPLTPAKAGELPTGSQRKAANQRGGSGGKVSILRTRPDLRNRAFAFWRAFSARALGGPPRDHVTDMPAMRALISAALLRFRGDEEGAMTDIAWGMREYIRDPRERHKPLIRLARMREEYGRAPPNFRPPAKREDATVSNAVRLPARVEVLAGRVGLGGGDTPERKIELARRALARCEEAFGLGLVSAEALIHARKCVEYFEKRERAET